MPSKDTKISDFNQYWKSDKRLSTNYADLWFLIKKVDGCKKILKNFLQQKYVNIFLVGIQCLRYGDFMV